MLARGAGARRRIRGRRVARAASRSAGRDRRPPNRAVVARFRRRAGRPRRRARARCGRPAPRSSSWRSKATASAIAVTLLELAAELRRDGGARAHRHGRCGARDPGAGGRFGSRVDLRRRRCGDIGQMNADDAARRVSASRSIGARPAVYGLVGRPVGAFGIARDAQRGVSRRPDSTRSICRCRPPMPTTSSRSREAFGLKGASVTIPFKVALFERVGRGDRSRAGSAR